MVNQIVNDVVDALFKDEKYVDAFGLKMPATALRVMRDLSTLAEEREAELDVVRGERDYWKAEYMKLHRQQTKLRYWKELALKKAKV